MLFSDGFSRMAAVLSTRKQTLGRSGLSLSLSTQKAIELHFTSLRSTKDRDRLLIVAQNLIRTIIALAASKHDMKARSISFKRVVQTLNAFQPLIAFQGERDPAFRMYL